MNCRKKLTDTTIRKLKPELREYTIRDTVVPSLGVRVHPSGGRSYVHFGDGRKVSLGPTVFKTIQEARRVSRAWLTDGFTDSRAIPSFEEFSVGTWRSSWVHRCKPSTIRWRDWNLDTRLLPAFGSLCIDRITPAMVHRWFDDYSRTAPANANHGLAILRAILNHAASCGHITTNPAKGVRPNPRPKLTRFLSREELMRLHHVLDRHDRPGSARSARRQQVAIIRLLLLTGCRKNEIVRLRKREVDGNCLRLQDSKTGPRKVFLNSEARTIIERWMAGDSEFLFPSPKAPHLPVNDNLPLWYAIRKEADIEDVRLHDLRHSFASHAVMQGTPLPVVARLLGHNQTSMTLRYAHTGDRETEAAAERIGKAVTGMLG